MFIQIDIGQADFKHAVFFIDGMGGIGAQVHQHLMDLSWVGFDNAGIFFYFLLDGDGGRQRGAQHLQGFFYNMGHLNGLALLFVLTAESQNLLDHVPGVFAGAENFF